MSLSQPPPLSPPARQEGSGWKIFGIVCISLFCCLVVFGGLIWAYLYTAKDISLSTQQKECFFTVENAQEWWTIDESVGSETIEAKVYIDQSKDLRYYFYGDDVNIECGLIIEKSSSDARISYQMEWQAFKLALKTSEATADRQDHVFKWGDDSKFAYQCIEGERYGFAFIARKGKRIYFLDAWGLIIEDDEQVRELLEKKLEHFETEKFSASTSPQQP